MKTNTNSPVTNPIVRRNFLAAAGAFTAAGLDPLGPEAAAALELSDSKLENLHAQTTWEQLRGQFLLPRDQVYMNNGSLGPSPSYVLQQTHQAWRELEQDPVGLAFGPLLSRAEKVRGKAADFLGCSSEEISVTRNTTEAMNTIAQGIQLQKGDRVLTTDHEHPGGVVCWEYYAKRRGVVIDRVSLPGPPQSAEQLVALIEEKLRKDTAVVSISEVTSTTGLRLPVSQIAEVVRANGSLLVVDGAQAPGALQVDVKQLDCDAYATSAHKWMLAPKGSGLLYIHQDARQRIDPLLLQHGSQVYTASTGTRDIPGIIGLAAAIEFLNRVGKERIERRVRQLRQQLYSGLQKLPRGKVASPPDGPLSSALVSFSLPSGVSCSSLAGTLRSRHKIIVKPVAANGLNAIRLSVHIYNSEEETEKLLAALKQELA
ncbi:MAG: hypothetical protein CMJ81_16395 [Planctomycetaceae bacterium]|nr:hypothetical protein [Planctomycetaceae bacterium]